MLAWCQPLADFIVKIEPDVDSHEAFADTTVRDAMKELWADPGVQKAVARGHEFALHDNLL
jgi:guanine nucleotide-binding protein subunit alpha